MQFLNNKQRVIVFGGSGMLGHAVTEKFARNPEIELYTTFRNPKLIKTRNDILYKAEDTFHTIKNENFDYAINCIGLIKQIKDVSNFSFYEINSLFPHRLDFWCKENNIKLIHISTDCVFSGAKGNYVETDNCDCDDAYSSSKKLGEVKYGMNIRTSLIGEELRAGLSLIEWAKSQRGKSVNGYKNHFWNGLTTKECAKSLEKIIIDNLYLPNETRHLFSSRISKYDLLKLINEKFLLDLKITSCETQVSVDRTLSTIYGFNSQISAANIQTMINNL
jgi:dTDP-4-dehydrorhamnose reductase